MTSLIDNHTTSTVTVEGHWNLLTYPPLLTFYFINRLKKRCDITHLQLSRDVSENNDLSKIEGWQSVRIRLIELTEVVDQHILY